MDLNLRSGLDDNKQLLLVCVNLVLVSMRQVFKRIKENIRLKYKMMLSCTHRKIILHMKKEIIGLKQINTFSPTHL